MFQKILQFRHSFSPYVVNSSLSLSPFDLFPASFIWNIEFSGSGASLMDYSNAFLKTWSGQFKKKGIFFDLTFKKKSIFDFFLRIKLYGSAISPVNNIIFMTNRDQFKAKSRVKYIKNQSIKICYKLSFFLKNLPH